MKLAFVGITVPPTLKTRLSHQGFTIQEFSELPESTKLGFEVVAIGVKDRDQLEKLPTLRTLFPASWIAWIVGSSHIADPAVQLALLQRDDQDAVWLNDTWEQLFWFHLQQAIEAGRSRMKFDALERDHASLKALSYEMSEHSRQLIQQLERDVELASRIQRRLLPTSSPTIPDIQVSVKFLPSVGGGGDYYDLFGFGDKKRFGILLADSETHGMAAALLAALLKIQIDEMKERFPDSASFVNYLNKELCTLPEGERAPLQLLYGILDRHQLEFRYTSTGNLRPLLWRGAKEQTIESSESPALGIHSETLYREQMLRLLPGDRLILYSGGLEPVLTSPKTKARTILSECLKIGNEQDGISFQNEVLARIDKYKEKQTLPDDITLIHLAVDPKALYLTKKKA